MEIRILGAHQGDWSGGDFISFLIDGHLAIDAGAIASRLSLAEQERIRHILITHRHYDHIKDLPSFGFNTWLRTRVTVRAIAEVKAALERTLFSDEIWINFFQNDLPGEPSMRFAEVIPGEPFAIDDYTILPVAANHAVPTVGYQVTGPDGGKFYYTSDNGPGAGKYWVAADPHVLATEVTMSDRYSEVARSVGHLTPGLLADEVEDFRSAKGYVPRIVAVHLNPMYEAEIVAELAAVSRRLGTEIEIATEGMRLHVGGL